jgi:peptidoglycan/LPS O-acetylase OafA/YrhL
MLQDIVPAATPNGAFWSIGVEALLYLAFPVALWLCRRLGVAAMLGCATVPVVAVAVLAYGGNPPDDHWLAPQLLPVFAAGIAAAGIVAAGDRTRRRPWAVLAAAAAVPVAAFVLLRGARWTVTHYFWVDLAVTPALTLIVVAVAVGRPVALVRLLSLRPLVRLGSYSYSLYLIHLPIVVAISLVLVGPRLGNGLPAFLATTVVAGALSLAGASVFAKIIEFPSRRRRSG